MSGPGLSTWSLLNRSSRPLSALVRSLNHAGTTDALALAEKLTSARLRTWKLVSGLSAVLVALGLAGVVYAATTPAPGKMTTEPLFWIGAGVSFIGVCCSLLGLVELGKGRNPGPQEAKRVGS